MNDKLKQIVLVTVKQIRKVKVKIILIPLNDTLATKNKAQQNK